jgi:FdhE protein
MATSGWKDRSAGPGRCPKCGHAAQVGCIRPKADGTALSLVCSLCLLEWDFVRGRCVRCGHDKEKEIAYYSADEIPHLQVMACSACRHYLHLVKFDREPRAVADVDEIAALPLDVWAHEKGFCKVQPNLVGI